jgi:hypothetical protein
MSRAIAERQAQASHWRNVLGATDLNALLDAIAAERAADAQREKEAKAR